jgi:hypothetical protein
MAPVSRCTVVDLGKGTPDSPAREWGRFEVCAPAGFVFAEHGTHTLIVFDAEERDRVMSSPLDPCTESECDYCSP